MQSSGAGLDISTGWDDRGFPTTATLSSGWQTVSKSYNEQGSLITSAPTTAAALIASQAPCFGVNCGVDGKVISATATTAMGSKGAVWPGLAGLGMAATHAGAVLL